MASTHNVGQDHRKYNGDAEFESSGDRFMAKKQIAPKPTTYHGQLFRSKLEAKWAVILDNLPNVLHWQYEPKTYTIQGKEWTYTPDFLISIFFSGKPHHLYLEIKPSVISEGYANFLAVVANHTRWPIVLFMTPLWAKPGRAFEFTGAQFLRGRQLSQPFNFLDAMPQLQPAIQKALTYRFDLR